jgi:SnoaL-like domain
MKLRRTLPPLVLLAVLGFGFAACKAVPRQADHAAAFRAILAEKTSEPTVVPGSETERAAIDRLKRFLGEWGVESLRTSTLQVYAPDAWLNDTLKTVRGATNIQSYFLSTAQNTESLTVQFDDVTRSGDGLYYFRWVMDNRLKSVAKGETLRTLGITVIRFDAQGRVLIHQDYWDSAAGLFDHIPLVGYGVRAVKARL